MPDAVFIFTFVKNEVRAQFIDGIVSEMHIHIFVVVRMRLFIRRGSQSAKPFLIDVYFQRRYTFEEHVDA